MKAIIFDCWGTLFYDDLYPHPFAEFSEKIGKDMKDYEYLKVFEEVFMLKPINDLETPIIELLKRWDMDNRDLHLLKKILEKTLTAQRAYPEVMEILNDLKKSYKLGLLTNAVSLFMVKLIDDFRLNDIFTVILPSYKSQILKPEEDMYSMILAQLNVDPSEAVMIGDSLQDDIQGAAKIGMDGVLLDRKNRFPNFKRRITSLKELQRFL